MNMNNVYSFAIFIRRSIEFDIRCAILAIADKIMIMMPRYVARSHRFGDTSAAVPMCLPHARNINAESLRPAVAFSQKQIVNLRGAAIFMQKPLI